MLIIAAFVPGGKCFFARHKSSRLLTVMQYENTRKLNKIYAFYWGMQSEGIVSNEFSKRMGVVVAETHELSQSEEHPFLMRTSCRCSTTWRRIERDDELISMLVQLESYFWQHVQDGILLPLPKPILSRPTRTTLR